jgi:hypothetical protein
LVAVTITAVQADVITSGDIYATTPNELQAGNGLLDLILFDGSTSGQENYDAGSGLDIDDANTDMPTGGEDTAVESYITSIGELRAFYLLNFDEPYRHNIGLAVDLNEQGGEDAYITLNALTVIVDYDLPPFGDFRDDPASGDIDSSEQNLTGFYDFGGTQEAWLGTAPVTLVVNEQGAGWADYIIWLDIDPFDDAFNDDTRILFHWDSEDHTNGGETIFISGTYIPEPATLSLLLFGGLVALRRRR